MECTGFLVDVSRNWNNDSIRLVFEVNEQLDLDTINDLAKGDKLSIKAEKYRAKRSLDANAYAWTLLHKLAAKVGMSAEEVYRTYIRSFGVCEVMPVRQDAIERWCSVWGKQGYGFVTEDMGECKNFKGYHNIKCFYGSSTYNTAEMSALIDAIVQDCKEQGIDTATPDEIARLKAAWQNQ